jgi:nucleoside-diphosphate-sugar epimerase
VIAILRHVPSSGTPPETEIEYRALGELAPGAEWREALRGTEIVIHLAQRAHRSATADVLATEPVVLAALAREAAEAGIRRFIYLSSIKAMGDATPPGRPFRAGDAPNPEDAYGRAKLASEQVLRKTADETGLQWTILRPPLVYGPGVGANFRALVRLSASRLPLPFAAIDNRRSFVAVDNLVDLIGAAATHPAAVGRVLLISDGRDFSTPELVRILAAAQGRPARLFPLSPALVSAGAHLPGIGPALRRLISSLQVDDTATRDALDWLPPVAAETALASAVRERGSHRRVIFAGERNHQ